MIARSDQLAAALSQRNNEAGSHLLKTLSWRLDRAYSCRKEELREIKRMVGKNENLWKSQDDTVDFMLPYLYRYRYRNR